MIDGWWDWSGEATLGFWGGLRAGSVCGTDDPIVGTYAYCGDLVVENDLYTVQPWDGIRQRFFFFFFFNHDNFEVGIIGIRFQFDVLPKKGMAIVKLSKLPRMEYRARLGEKTGAGMAALDTKGSTHISRLDLAENGGLLAITAD